MENTLGLDFREALPNADEYLALFETTGWNCEYHLTAEDLHNALRHSWYLIGAYDQDRLGAAGRVISDGIFHALIVDVIVSPEYRAQGLGSSIMRRLFERCRQGRLRDVQLFCARGKAPFYSQLGFVLTWISHRVCPGNRSGVLNQEFTVAKPKNDIHVCNVYYAER